MRPSRRSFLTGALAGTAGLVAGSLAPLGSEAFADGAEPSEVDLGFCTDMTAHHVQALAMCQRVLGRDTGDAVQAAAAEVLQNQAIEVGQMRAWLVDWDEPTDTPETAMAWMGHGGGVPLGDMPGYASEVELAELSTATGLAQGRRWLELMRSHHVGGVHMAEHAASHARAAKVIRLASTQARTQRFEIAQYDVLLAGAYA